MTEIFENCHNDILALFPPKSKKQAEVHREDVWYLLKFNTPIIQEVFSRVRREWDKGYLPPPKYFDEIKREVLYGEKEKSIWHKMDFKGNPHPDCKCEGCKIYKRAIESKCLNLKCNSERTPGDEFCNRCHVIAKSYYCTCDLCKVHIKRLNEAERVLASVMMDEEDAGF